MEFRGVFSVLPTPFLENGDLDLESLRRTVDLFMNAGVEGLTALGVTGEVARLTESERMTVLETVIDQVSGRVVVIAGASADGLRTCIANSRAARAAGANAVMISPPRMPKLNSKVIQHHYDEVAAAADVDIVVQDYPPISGYTMEPELLARIAANNPRARTIKLEDPPTPYKATQILKHAQETPVSVLGGLGGVFLLEELMAGAGGVMTGFSYPEILVAVVRSYATGNIDDAAETFYRHVPLMRFEFQEGIGMAIRKEMLRRRGALHCAQVREPGSQLDASTTAALDRVLSWSGISG